MTLIADLFLNLQSPKNMVREISKEFLFRGPFDNKYRKWAETLFKAKRQHFYHIDSSL